MKSGGAFMKPFLCIDLTSDKKNTAVNGEEFLTATPSLASSQSLEDSQSEAKEKLEQSKLPKPLRIIQTVCGFTGFLILVSILRAMDSVTFSEAYQNVPFLFWIIGICLLIWMILFLFGLYRKKTVLSTEESTRTFEYLESREEALFSELGVPATAKDADVFFFYYKTKGDKLKISQKGMQNAPYLTKTFKAFADAENLHLADLTGRYSFPVSSIKGIRTVTKHTVIDKWTKPYVYNKGIYQQYKLQIDQYGRVHCKNHHVMSIERDGELWEVYIPCYELPLFEKLTGLKAE